MATALKALTAASLADQVAERAGPWPETGVPFLDNLDRLLRACAATANLNPVGRDVLQRVAARHLRNLHEVLGRPDGDAPIAPAPIVVTGLPRTGTTLLHNLLALDPAHRALRLWEALQPGSAPSASTDPASRRRDAERWLHGFWESVPGFRAIHPASADGPEECDALLQNAFASQHFDDMFDAAEYSHWLAESTLDDEYACYARQLRLLGAPEGATWVLKSPGHLGHLDALRRALPGVTVVWCHRAAPVAVASYASLIVTLRRAYADSPSPAVIGRQAMHRAATAARRAREARGAAIATGQADAFVDVDYRDLVADPVAAVEAVYERVGRSLGTTLARAMREWVGAHPAGEHGLHRYSLDDFGLTPTEVDATVDA